MSSGLVLELSIAEHGNDGLNPNPHKQAKKIVTHTWGDIALRKPGSAGRLRRDGARPLRRAITGAKLLRNDLKNVTFTGR